MFRIQKIDLSEKTFSGADVLKNCECLIQKTEAFSYYIHSNTRKEASGTNMGSRINVALHILSLVSFVVALAVNFASLFGTAWWVRKGFFKKGLLRECNELLGEECKFRKYLFEFQDKGMFEYLILNN